MTVNGCDKEKTSTTTTQRLTSVEDGKEKIIATTAIAEWIICVSAYWELRRFLFAIQWFGWWWSHEITNFKMWNKWHCKSCFGLSVDGFALESNEKQKGKIHSSNEAKKKREENSAQGSQTGWSENESLLENCWNWKETN